MSYRGLRDLLSPFRNFLRHIFFRKKKMVMLHLEFVRLGTMIKLNPSPEKNFCLRTCDLLGIWDNFKSYLTGFFFKEIINFELLERYTPKSNQHDINPFTLNGNSFPFYKNRYRLFNYYWIDIFFTECQNKTYVQGGKIKKKEY